MAGGVGSGVKRDPGKRWEVNIYGKGTVVYYARDRRHLWWQVYERDGVFPQSVHGAYLVEKRIS